MIFCRPESHDKLGELIDNIESGKVSWRDSLEDIHMHIEHELIEMIGDTAKKIHTGRSRNDQVHSNYYGTVLDSVVQLLQKNIIVILEIDYQGAETVKKQLPQSRNIFVLPPSLKVLEKRLRERATDLDFPRFFLYI